MQTIALHRALYAPAPAVLLVFFVVVLLPPSHTGQLALCDAVLHILCHRRGGGGGECRGGWVRERRGVPPLPPLKSPEC